MILRSSDRPITIFTPSAADLYNTNAQNLTVKEIVARLPEERFRVVMFCQNEPDPRIARRKNTEILPYRKHGNTVRLLRACLQSYPDVYFFPRTGALDTAFLAVRKRMRLRTAVVSYVVMMMNKSARNGPLTRSIRQADIVCANSNFVSQTVRECFGRDSHVIYDGVDRRFFFPSSRKSSGRLVVLYAGSFQPRKRVELIIEQAARQPDVDFWLAGKGETETNCRALSMRLGCRNVRFLGHLLPDQLGFHMRGADLFLFPSVLEGHPQVLLQAAASGLPCIAMNLYRPDYVVHGETGFLVDSDVQLSASLQLLLRDQKLRESMSSAAISHTQRFEWASITEQWGRIFEEAVGRRNEHLGRKADLCAATAGAE